MKTFNYHSAKNVKEASKLASSNSVFLAGGMSTIPSMKLGFEIGRASCRERV